MQKYKNILIIIKWPETECFPFYIFYNC